MDLTKKELTDALAEHGKAIADQQALIQKAVDEAKAENKKEVDELKAELKKMEDAKAEMQKQLDELDIEIQKARKEPSEKVKTFAAELREKMTKEIAVLKNISENKAKELIIEMKSFLETATASITTGSLLPTPQFEVGVSKAPDRMPFMMDIIRVLPASGLTIYWTQRKTRTDNSGFVTEGTTTTLAAGTVTQSVLGYETKNASMQNLLAFIKVSNNSIDDVEWLLSEIQTELTTLFVLKYDAAILSGTTAVNGWNGILTGATAFSSGGDTLPAGVTPNKFDALVFALSQVEQAHFTPNYIILHPADVRDMKLVRDDRGAYMLPPNMANGNNVSVDGVRIISNTGMTKGSYLVGDFSKATFWMRKQLDLKIHDQNEDDAINQLKTVTLYGRGTLVVKENDATAFVTDTFADTIAEITSLEV